MKQANVVGKGEDLATETVQSAALALQSVDDVHGGDRLAFGVFGVGDGIADHVLQEHFQDAPGLLVDEARDTLHTATTSQSTDGGLGDALDVVAQHFAMPLGASLAQAFSSFAASGHFVFTEMGTCVGEVDSGFALVVVKKKDGLIE